MDNKPPNNKKRVPRLAKRKARKQTKPSPNSNLPIRTAVPKCPPRLLSISGAETVQHTGGDGTGATVALPKR